MKEKIGSINKKGEPPRDLPDCLAMVPMSICSPSKLVSRRRGGRKPLFQTKTSPLSSQISEPDSPKITCSGQIKVRSKTRVQQKQKRCSLMEILSIKRDILQLFVILSSLHIRCFGSSEDQDGEDGKMEEKRADITDSGASVTKWFMQWDEKHVVKGMMQEERDGSVVAPLSSVPPPNALLLMRCRSAPEERRFDDRYGEDGTGGGDDERWRKVGEFLTCHASSFFEDPVKRKGVLVKADHCVGSKLSSQSLSQFL